MLLLLLLSVRFMFFSMPDIESTGTERQTIVNMELKEHLQLQLCHNHRCCLRYPFSSGSSDVASYPAQQCLYRHICRLSRRRRRRHTHRHHHHL